MVGRTLQITLINLLYLLPVYYVLSWLPQLVASCGFSPAQAATESLYSNILGAIAGALVGRGSIRVGLKRLTHGAFTGMAALTASLGGMQAYGALIGICLYSGMVALLAIMSRTFVNRLRATGVGFVIGSGRAATSLVPLVSGLLFAAGFGRDGVSIAMGGAALAAALLLIGFRIREPGEAELPPTQARRDAGANLIPAA